MLGLPLMYDIMPLVLMKGQSTVRTKFGVLGVAAMNNEGFLIACLDIK